MCNTFSVSISEPLLFLVSMQVVLTSSRQTSVSICVHKELHLKDVSDLLGVEYKDALEQHYIGWVQGYKLILPKISNGRHLFLRMAKLW